MLPSARPSEVHQVITRLRRVISDQLARPNGAAHPLTGVRAAP
jgi:hypothetical protein